MKSSKHYISQTPKGCETSYGKSKLYITKILFFKHIGTMNHKIKLGGD